MTFGSTRGSVPVVLRLPSVRPHTAVASEPAYVVGTATTGRPVVRAIAFARPVVEPPPTLTIASTLCVAAASRARAATSTGTCITTSSYRSRTRRFPVRVPAVSISRLDAITMTRLAPSSATSRSRLAAASPEPKLTRCGRVSWTKRMSLSSRCQL